MLDRLRRMLPQQQVEPHLLADEGEYVIDVVEHHWVAYLKPALWAFGSLLCLAFVFVGPIQLGAIFVAGFLGLGAWAGYLALGEHLDVFVITNMRVFRSSGVFSHKTATMPISRILDITVDTPFVGRVLGYGHFVFESAAQEQGLRDIRMIGRPGERDLTIQRVVQRSGLRGPRQPS